jgi:hypothetical protein
MEQRFDASLDPSPEQVLYARVLEKGMYIGLLCLFVTFAIYLSGILKPYIPLNDLPQHWPKNVHDYVTEARIQTGWGWLGMLGYGDFLNFVGVAILAGVTILCYLSIVPTLLRRKDFLYAVLALLEALILTVAASGIIEVGH